jgi:hypothetical protein
MEEVPVRELFVVSTCLHRFCCNCFLQLFERKGRGCLTCPIVVNPRSGLRGRPVGCQVRISTRNMAEFIPPAKLPLLKQDSRGLRQQTNPEPETPASLHMARSTSVAPSAPALDEEDQRNFDQLLERVRERSVGQYTARRPERKNKKNERERLFLFFSFSFSPRKMKSSIFEKVVTSAPMNVLST